MLGKSRVTLYDVGSATTKDLMNHQHLIMGIPTWGIGELQDDWDDFLHQCQDVNLSGKTAALFGLGDQESYPDTFADALGKLYDSLVSMGCRLVGEWTDEAYSFSESVAYRKKKFVGLVLDEENQADLSERRIQSWLQVVHPHIN